MSAVQKVDLPAPAGPWLHQRLASLRAASAMLAYHDQRPEFAHDGIWQRGKLGGLRDTFSALRTQAVGGAGAVKHG